MTDPCFSIVIPAYNCGSYISTAIDSILNQSFYDFEIIVIDNKSSDSTLDIFKSYDDDRIRIYSEVDNGIYDAMNKGISLSNGKWLYFMGADDHFYNDAVLENINRYIKTSNSEMVYGNVFSSRLGGEYDGVYSSKKLYYQNICHQAIFYNKEVFKIVGGYYTKYHLYADWLFNIRCFFEKTVRISYCPQIIAFYGENGKSSNQRDINFLNDKYFWFIRYGFNKIGIGFFIIITMKKLIEYNFNIMRFLYRFRSIIK